MRRRLLRLVVLSVAVPVASRAAGKVADRLEATNGPTVASRSLRRAGGLAGRYWRF